MTLLDHIVAVGATWQKFTVAMDLYRHDTASAESMRLLVDARNAHVAATEAATLAALRAGHGPVLERAKDRAARCRE